MFFVRKKLDPVTAYLLLTGGYAFFVQFAATVNLVFQTSEAGLNPLQLVLVGAVLEATIFICEVPTGVLADLRGRRISVVIGLCLIGGGMAVTGALPEFETILAGQVVWGVGYTFVSGAQQAWIADEVGVERAGGVYMRSSQMDSLFRIVAVPLAVLMALVELNLPLLIGGAAMPLLGLMMLSLMTEDGFRRARSQERTLSQVRGQFVAGGRAVRQAPLLLTLFGIAALWGMASEGFDRLYVAHFYAYLGFPTFVETEPIVWFGIIRIGSILCSIAALEVMQRRVNTNSHESIARWLFSINALQIVVCFVFAFAGNFGVGMVMFISAVSLSRIWDPLYLAWINQNVDSSARATVISMSSQSDSIGQIAGGPALGLVGTLASLRAAMVGVGVVMVPALLLNSRAFRLGRTRPPLPEPGTAAGS